jgi:hypothetical protein
MASYTSTQSGNFTDSSTWGGGGYPSANGDTFSITAGHTVTYNTNSPVSTGFGDSNIYGTLTHASGATHIRMNGRLYIQTDGLYQMNPSSTHSIKGTQGDQHGIWQENKDGASFIAEGSAPMVETTLSAAVDVYAGSYSFTSASSFKAGEWCAVYRDQPTSYATDNDEGFIIHEINGDIVYFREFVGPSATIESSRTNQIKVDNAKVFRVNQRLIFGTGTNRNVANKITNINYNSNIITLESSINGTVNGLTVYTTGVHRPHASGDRVRKIATIPSADASSGATQITLIDATNFDIGDKFIIEHSWSASTTYSSNVEHTISGKSGNTLTFSPALPAAVNTTNFCAITSRDCLVKSDSTSDYGFYYSENYTSNWNKRLWLKNVEFDRVGNSGSSLYRGIVVRGYHSTPWRANGGVIEGCVVKCQNYRGSRSGLWWYSNGHYRLCRNNVVFHTESGIANYYCNSPHDYNNFCVNSTYSGFRGEGYYHVYWEVAYNRTSGSDDYGLMLYPAYENGGGFHHNHANRCNKYPFLSRSYGTASFYQNEFYDHQYAPVTSSSNPLLTFVYNKLSARDSEPNSLEGIGKPIGSGYSTFDRCGGWMEFQQWNEHNYEIDNTAQWTYHIARIWDKNEKAWRVYRRDDSSGNAGFTTFVLLQPGETLYLKSTIKLVSGYSGNNPTLAIYPQNWSYSRPSGIFGSSFTGSNIALNSTTTTPSWSTTAYTSHTLSLENTVGVSQYVMVGVLSSNSNMSEGWYQKPDIITVSRARGAKNREFIKTSDWTNIPTQGINANTRITRLGGRI